MLVRTAKGDWALGLVASDPDHPELRSICAEFRRRMPRSRATDEQILEMLARVLAEAPPQDRRQAS